MGMLKGEGGSRGLGDREGGCNGRVFDGNVGYRFRGWFLYFLDGLV